MTVIYAILIFGLLIFVHELGHFIVAKLSGIAVLQFNIGFGPAIFKKRYKETIYALRILPLGGSVMLKSEDGEDDEEELRQYAEFLEEGGSEIFRDQEFEDAFADCDVIATPTSPFTAFKLGENVDDPLKMYAADICTITVNIASLPAISIPCGNGADGMPIGLQLIGPRFSESVLFNVADHYEKLAGGFNKLPVIK